MGKKVLVTSRSFGKISDEPLRIMRDAGFEVVLKGQEFHQEEFERIIPEYDALIIGAHPFPEGAMEKCDKLQIICKHGAGLDNIPLEKARERNIAVCNTPGTNSNAVADLAVGLMLAAVRNIVLADSRVKRGEWRPEIGVDLCYKTLGLFGFGAIARNVARRVLGFGMRIMVYDPYVKQVPKEFENKVELCTSAEIIQDADIISMHMPLTEETRNMITLKEMRQMKTGSYIINTARGGIVNESDLYQAVKEGHIAGAALDVSVEEPMDMDNPLRSLENVIITPHLGMYSREAIGAVSLICAQNIVARMEGKALQHQVI